MSRLPLTAAFLCAASAAPVRAASPEALSAQGISWQETVNAVPLRAEFKKLREAARAAGAPAPGTQPLAGLLSAYHLSLNDALPHSGVTIGAFLQASGIDPAAAVMTVDPQESVSARLRRWGIDENSRITVDTPQAFRTLILATLESYFRVHAQGVPKEPHNPLNRDDQFANALIRETFGHDVYINSLTRPGSPGLIDGSVLFETAFAPVETGDDSLIRNRFLLLSQLEMIRLDAEDGVMNGREQKLLATRLFDSAAGTHYADLVESCSPALAAVVDPAALQGPTPLPVSLPALQDIAARNHVAVETFIRSLVAFHALAVGGVGDASSTAPLVWKRWDYTEAEGALAPVRPRPFAFGFIDYLFEFPVKDKIRADQHFFSRTRVDPYLYGDGSHPGTLGPEGFMDKILFGNFGASCRAPASTP